MSPENPHSRDLVGELTHRLDEETMSMGGGFQQLEAFQQIIALGESALPDLLSDMERPAWWRLQAVWTIAHAVGKPIEFPEEIIGERLEVRDFTVDWVRAHGYLPCEPATE